MAGLPHDGRRVGFCRFFVPFFYSLSVLPTSRLALVARVVLLPLLLALAVVLGLGSYFETSDDGSLAWLFAGVLSARPVASVPLYLHGYGHLLAAAYTAAPAGPWLGLLLAGLLAIATVLWFAVLERLLRPYLRPGWLALALALFFGLAWLEHWLWFSHARVALLLASGGVLFAAQRPGRRGPFVAGLAALLAAWLVRPGLAGLAVAAVLPAVLLLAGGWSRARPLLLGAGLLMALAFGLAAWYQAPADARVRARDARLAQILDYEQLRPYPRTAADSLGTAAVSLWLLGDSAVVDPVLRGPVYRLDAADFISRVVPAKLKLRAGLLLRDYFPVLLALLATAGAARRQRWPGRRGFWLVQLGFVAGLAGVAGILKLPPRLAFPLLDCWLLTNLLFGLQALAPSGSTEVFEEKNGAFEAAGAHSAPRSLGEGPGGRFVLPDHPSFRFWLSIALLVALISLYAAKTWHRHQVLGQEQRQHENALAGISRKPGRLRVLAGTNDLLKSLSPFRTYSLGPGPVLQLSGWAAHDPSQARLRRVLTGTTDQTECLRRLARPGRADAEAFWLLTPETAHWLNRRSHLDGPPMQLVPAAPALPANTVSPWREYRVQSGPKP